MEFYLNFNKPHISAKVFNFLELNLKDDEAKKNLARLTKGLKLQYKEANAFIDTLLYALTMNDGEVDTPFIIKKSNEDGGSDDPFSDIASQIPPADNSHPKEIDPTQGTSSAAIVADKLRNSSPKKDKPLCKFYEKGKCRHNNDCRFNHPKICNKFRSFGLKIHNEKGCDNQKCQFLHPNACRDSLKRRHATEMIAGSII